MCPQTTHYVSSHICWPIYAHRGYDKLLSMRPLTYADKCSQRPDDAIHRGYDKLTEWDMSKPGNFISNFEPLNRTRIKDLVEDVIGFEKYTEPMQVRFLPLSFCYDSVLLLY